jgi:hypothetical protein
MKLVKDLFVELFRVVLVILLFVDVVAPDLG